MKKTLGFLLLAGLVGTLFAADAKVEEPAFTTHIELGYTNTAGNTQSQDLAGTLAMKYNMGASDVRFVGHTLYSNNEDFDTNITTTTKNRWDAELNYDYNFNETWAFNYLLGGKGDKFSTYTYQAYTGPGAIWTALKTESHDLKFQANVLWSFDEYQAPYDTDSNDTLRDYAAYQASMEYVYQITKTSKFVQYLMYRSEFADATNYFVKSKTGVEAKASDMVSLGLAYTVDYTNNKADDVRSYTDRVFIASLIVDF